MFYDENTNIFDNINGVKIVSLGNYCLTSMILKDHNLKNNSYPYDWMVTCINNVSHCIKDNFSEFLNKNNYHYIHNKTKNTFYYDNTLKLFPKKMLAGKDHQHHNFSNQEHYDYINRCVNRFNELDKFNKIIFVMIQPLYLLNNKENDYDVKSLYNILFNKFSNSKVILLVFNITKKNNLVYKENKINNNCIIYELESKIAKGSHGMMWYDKKGINKFLEIIKSF